MWKKLLSVLASVAVLSANTAVAVYDAGTSTPPDVVNPLESLTVSPSTFNPYDGEKMTVTVNLREPSVVTLQVLNPSTSQAIATIYSNEVIQSSKTVVYGGIKADGTYLSAGDYVMNASVANVAKTVATDGYKNFTVESGSVNPPDDSDLIENASVDPYRWNPYDEELDIEWTLTDDVDNFTLTAEKSGEDDIELMDEEDLNDDDYGLLWDGLDEDWNEIEEGTWYIVFEADGEFVEVPVIVDYEGDNDDDDDDRNADVEITDIFVSKTSFDNDIGEFSYVIFRMDDDAEVTVEVMKGTKDIETLLDEKDLDGDVWHAVKWDGTDDDGDEVKEGSYKFKVTAKDDDNDKTSRTANVEVKEDDVSSNRANVTEDYLTPVVMDKDTSAGAQITYKLDDDAEVTVEIFKGDSTSRDIVTLEDEKDRDAGTYTIKWDGRDDDNDKLTKNTKYSYLITAKYNGSSTKVDKEKGYFVVGEPGYIDGSTTYDCVNSGFWDVYSNSPYCEALVWAKSRGIINGYQDGSFRAYSNISRVEALKVALKAYNLPIVSDDYTNLGFSDVEVGAWYMKFIRTGKFYGMANGYGTSREFGPDYKISRVEFLKYLGEAAGAEVPVCNSPSPYNDTQSGVWYSDYVCFSNDHQLFETYGSSFYPSNQVTRGEIVLSLYKLYKDGVL